MTRIPRIPPLPRERWTEDARDVFAFWEGPAARETGSRSNLMMTLATHPPVALASLEFGRYIMTKSSLTPRQRELVVLRVAWRYGSAYQWAQHVVASRRMGFTEAEFEALQQPANASAWSAEEHALVAAIDQLCDHGGIEDQTWTVLTGAMSEAQLMDFVHSAGFYAMNAWVVGAFGVRPEPELDAVSPALPAAPPPTG